MEFGVAKEDNSSNRSFHGSDMQGRKASFAGLVVRDQSPNRSAASSIPGRNNIFIIIREISGKIIYPK